MALVDVVGVELIEQMGLTLRQIRRHVIVPHQAHATRTPTATRIGPGAALWLATRRIGVAFAPEMLVELQRIVDIYMMRGFVELGGIACIVCVVA